MKDKKLKDKKLKNFSAHVDFKLVVLLFIASIVWILNYTLNFRGYSVYTSDVMSYASMAQHFIEGKGFTLEIALPLEVSLLQKEPLFPFASARYPYLHPLWMALFLKTFGVSSFSIALSTGVAYVAFVGAAYLLAKKLFNEKVAIVSSVFIMFDHIMLDCSINGLSESLYIVVFILSIYFIFRHKSNIDFFYAGLFFGLAQSIRMMGLVYIFPLLLFIALKEDQERLKKALLFLCAFTLFSFPAFYNNYQNYESIMGSTPKYYYLFNLNPETLKHQAVKILANTIDPFQYLRDHVGDFSSKVINNTILQLKGVFSGKLVSIPFFYLSLISLVFLKTRQDVKKFQIFIFALISIQLVLGSAVFVVYRYFQPFIPFLIIFSVALIFNFSERYASKKIINPILTTGMIVIFLVLFPFKPWNLNFADAKESRLVLSKWSGELGAFIQKNTEADNVIVSDVPWLTGWYGKRHSIWLPASPKLFNEMDEKIIKVDYLFLSPHYTLQRWENKHWQTLYRSPRKWAGFVPYKVFKYGSYKAILYKREK